MKKRTLLLQGACLLSLCLLAAFSSRASVITQTVSQASADANGWAVALWGSPAAVATPGNEYVTPGGFTLRTPNNLNPAAFAGNKLTLIGNPTLAFKHGNLPAVVNLVLNPGTISQFQGATGTTNCPLAGSLEVLANSTLTAPNGPGPRHIWIQSTLSGSGNLTVNMFTNALFLSGNASGYSGNWNNTGGRMEIWSGTTSPLGSGTVTLVNETNSLTFNSTNDLVINNAIVGAGFVVKQNTNTVTLAGVYSFTGGLTNNAGMLVLSGTGSQSATLVGGNAILRLASSTALGYGLVRVDPNNAQTGRLELSNNVTLQTYQPLQVAMRNTATPAIQNISGNNVIADQLSVQSGGGNLWIQADAGTSLELAGGITSGATGSRAVTLQGDGNGLVSGLVDNGMASSLSLMKAGNGTWTLNNYNSYSGATFITNGVLKLGPSGAFPSTLAIHLEPAGKLDVSAVSGFMLGAQVLRGKGAVLGDLATSFGSTLEVGFAGQFGALNFSNNLTLGGSDTLRFDLGSAGSDVLNIKGSLILNGFTTNLISLPEGFVENGTYRLINYTGTLQGGGSFVLVTPGTRQTFTLDTSTSGQVNLVVAGNPTSLFWSGDGSVNVWDIGAAANWTGNVFYNADAVTFNDSGSATPEINVAVAVQPGSMTVNNTAQAYTFTNLGISCLGSLIKRGTNLLALANDGNNFQGPIVIEEGILSIGNGGANGSLGSGPITNHGALVLNRASGGATLSGPISGPGLVRVTGGGSTLTLSGTNAYTGPTLIETNCALHLLSDSALGATNSGTTVLAGGRVGFANKGNWVVAEPVELNGDGLPGFPGALYANTDSNNVVWTGPITLGSPSHIRAVNNYVRLTLSNSVTANNQSLLCTAAGTGTTITFADTLSLGSEATLTKENTGLLVLAGNSNLCGATVVNAGTLLITTTNAPRIGDVTINAGTLQIGDGGPNGSLPTGLINLAGSGTRLLLNSSNQLTLDKELTGVGALSKLCSNTVVILSSNSFSGNVTTGSGSPSPNGLGAGVIRLLNQYGLGNGLVPKTVQLIRSELQLVGGLTIPAPITFELSGGRFVTPPGEGPGLIPIRSISGHNVIQGNVNLIGGAGSGEIAVDSDSLTLNGTVSATMAGRILYFSGAGAGILNGPLNNNGTNLPALTKQGPGTWTLNAANDYSGATVIQGGTLALGANASVPNTPSIQLLSNAVLNVSALAGGFNLGVGQTLKGNGSVSGSVAAAGTVSPGTSVGALSVSGNLTLSGVTIMELNRTNVPNADLLTAGTLVFGGTLTITNIGPELQAGDVFNLFDGALSGAFGVTNLPALASTDLYWDLSLLNSQGIIKVASTQALPPTIQPPTLNGNNLVLQVQSQAGFNYVLEATPQIAPLNWTPLQTLPGGGALTFTIPVNSATPQQFYRIRIQ